MDRTWLVFDVNYVCYRAFYSTGGLSHNGEATGVVFGFLRDLGTFAREFGSTDMVFTFDHGKGLREQEFPWYKEARRLKKRTDEEEQGREDMHRQLEKIKLEYLEKLGYGNVFFKRGYEADDIMARVVHGLPEGDRAILISGDEDLYQLLSSRAAVYHPVKKVFLTARDFKAKYGIHPRDWVRVKAIAGCESDSVPGVEGVGEVLACKYLRGEKLPTTKKHGPLGKVVDRYANSRQYYDSLKVVTLPYPGADAPIRPQPDATPDPEAFRAVCEELGIESLLPAAAGIEWS